MKGKSKKKRILCLFLACCLFLTGCSGISFGKSEKDRFDEYTEGMFKEEIAQNTINLHYTLAYPENYGITDYDVSLGELSMADFEDAKDELENMKKELEGFNREKLNDDQKLTYDLFMDYVDTELPVVDLYLYAEFLSPLKGYQSSLPVLLAEYTFRTEKDIEDYLALLEEIDDMFGDIMVFEKEKEKAGLFMPDFAI